MGGRISKVGWEINLWWYFEEFHIIKKIKARAVSLVLQYFLNYGLKFVGILR